MVLRFSRISRSFLPGGKLNIGGCGGEREGVEEEGTGMLGLCGDGFVVSRVWPVDNARLAQW